MTTTILRMQQRRDETADWAAADPVLLPGEVGYDTDEKRFKIGDGTSSWSELDYVIGIPADLDPATAALVTSGGDLQAALEASYVGVRDQAGTPVTTTHTYVVLDEFGDVDDIVSEAI